jgi:hypothetical protein
MSTEQLDGNGSSLHELKCMAMSLFSAVSVSGSPCESKKSEIGLSVL